MIKHAMKTLSFAFLVSAASAQADESGVRPLADHDKDSRPEVVCSTQADVVRGWEYQLELLEARMAARPAQTGEVKGAIIAPPFPTFAPYRTDLPDRFASKAQSPDAHRAERSTVNREDGLPKR